ncbi:hypothetical protein NQZ68_003436 [Dissostichus eleginoides]|nr:hypothetical protein NQZ68_003436 [Dissostichus eleginoides]
MEMLSLNLVAVRIGRPFSIQGILTQILRQQQTQCVEFSKFTEISFLTGSSPSTSSLSIRMTYFLSRVNNL